MKSLVILLAGLALTGCATLPSGKPDPRDPWERMNRSTHAFNDAIDRAVARPVAKAYVKVAPRFVRTGISNVFNNLNTLNTIVNDMLQGKMKQAGNEFELQLLKGRRHYLGGDDPKYAKYFDDDILRQVDDFLRRNHLLD